MAFCKQDLFPAALAMLLAPALQAQVAVTVSSESIRAGETAVLSAEVATAGPQPLWEWSLAPASEGSLTVDAAGRAHYQAPAFLIEPVTVQIRVHPASDRTAVTVTTLQVKPALPFDNPLLNTLTGYLGHGLLEPNLSILAGSPAPRTVAEIKAGPFQRIMGLALLADHPDPRIRGKWAVVDGDASTVQLMDAEGRLQPWLGRSGEKDHVDRKGPGARFYDPLAIAVRPAAAGMEWQAAIVDAQAFVIRAVDAGGMVSTLAGVPGSRGRDNGNALQATFVSPRGAVYGPDGALYVADGELIRRIAKGQVTTFAGVTGHQGSQDGPAGEGTFNNLTAIALAPGTGNLLVCDSHRVRSVSPQGLVTTLAGGVAPGFEDWKKRAPTAEKPDRMAGIACFHHPAGILVVSGRALIADRGNHAIRVLDLTTGELSTVAGHPTQPSTRTGRLAPGAGVEPKDCAALGNPRDLAIGPQGQLVVSLKSCVAELNFELGAGSAQAWLAGIKDSGEAKAECKEERKSQGFELQRE
jgi:hypothetical protein